MNADALTVTIREVEPVRVVYQTLAINAESGSFNEDIGACFALLKSLMQQLGHDPNTLRIIGVPTVVDRQLQSYDCCIELPDGVEPPAPFSVKTLAGGRCAILSMPKDAPIGEWIGRFFGEYVPEHQLAIDPMRPSYEVYYESTMDFCVPLA